MRAHVVAQPCGVTKLRCCAQTGNADYCDVLAEESDID
jgi:hypothetical protein